MTTYGLQSATGQTINFDNTTYVLEPGMVGFGVPPVSVRIDSSARDGGIFRHSRREPRNIDLPVTVFGSTPAVVETRLRALARVLQDTAGPTRLINYRPNGNLFLRLHYVGGAESQWGEDQAGRTFARWLLSFQAPQPYWESATRQTFTLSPGTTGRGLLPQLTKLKLASGQALGSIAVANAADVQTFPIWRITGPVNNFRARLGGLSFSFPTVPPGVELIVDTEQGTVRQANGLNRYSLLGPAPKLFPFPPGNSTVLVDGEDATLNTSIVVEYPLRFEVVHR